MQRHIAQNKFGQADLLFQQGRFDESLALLDELDQAFPNSPNVMYPRARCLLEIGETNEALDILDDLTAHYQHPEAEALKREVQEAIVTLTQPSVAEARHHVGPTPDHVRPRHSSSHIGEAPVMSRGNVMLIAVTAAILLAIFASIIVVALLQ
jgi:thioredoxin-like negative regulator of GroEL